MRLKVAIGAGDVSDFDGEKDVAIVVGPVNVVFYGLVVRELARLRGRFPLTCGSGCGCKVQSVDFDVFKFLLALADGIRDQGEFVAVARSGDIVDSQWNFRYLGCSRSEV